MSLNWIGKLSLILLLFSTLSCPSQDDEPMEEIPPGVPNGPTVINYLALGDSYTIGQGVEEDERWPIQLSAMLKQNGYLVESTEIIARTGWTTGDLITAVESALLDDFNLVSLLIGVNNQFQNQNFDTFKEEFDQLLEKAIEIAGSKERVFVVSIPDYGVTPFGGGNSSEIAEELDEYNAFMEQQCLNLDVPFINITDKSRELGAGDGALAADNLHPSGSQYSEWVGIITPVVLGLLKE